MIWILAALTIGAAAGIALAIVAGHHAGPRQ